MIAGIQNEFGRMGLEPGTANLSFDEAIESFESIFISQLVRGLREAFSDELSEDGGGYGKGIYMSWFDQALSDAISKAGGLGLKAQLQRVMPMKDDNNLLDQNDNSDINASQKRKIDVYK